MSSFILAVLSNLAVFWRAFYLVTFSVTYAWIYIRYFRVNPNSSILGDDSAEFSFMTIFPEPIQPVFKVIELFLANICKLGRRNFQQRANHLNPTEDNVSVDMVGDDPTAERRKALAIKIINDKLAEKRNKQESAVPFSKAEN